MPRLKHVSNRTLPKDFDGLVRLYPPRVIRDEADYDNVQEMIDALTSIAAPTKGQTDYLETLTILFAEYEDDHFAIETDDVSPLEMLKFVMEQSGMTGSDLGRLLGERSLGAKILRADRELSKAHIRKLADHFKVEPGLFF